MDLPARARLMNSCVCAARNIVDSSLSHPLTGLLFIFIFLSLFLSSGSNCLAFTRGRFVSRSPILSAVRLEIYWHRLLNRYNRACIRLRGVVKLNMLKIL